MAEVLKVLRPDKLKQLDLHMQVNAFKIWLMFTLAQAGPTQPGRLKGCAAP